MTPEQIEQERAAFEAWYCFGNPNDKCFAKNEIGSYSNPMTVIAFNVWLARAEQSAWISVEDRLPEWNKEVLVVWTDGVFGFATRIETKYHEERWNWETAALSETITHWQPLTEPPKAA